MFASDETIGVIGGADGPTAILTSSSNPAFWPAVILILLLGIGAVWFFLHRRKK